MVFIESPCGVGFSYSDYDTDYASSDSSTATDNYHFIQAFFRRFPEYASNDLYLTSESYGGHCNLFLLISCWFSLDLPTLAKEILDKNDALRENELLLLRLNFKGFAVGNPYTTVYTGLPAMIETGWGHQLISQPTMNRFREHHCLEMDTPNYPVRFIPSSSLDISTVGDLWSHIGRDVYPIWRFKSLW